MKILNHIDKIKEYMEEGDLDAPISVELDLTNACNHRCPKCSTTMLHELAKDNKVKETSYFTEKSAIDTIELLHLIGTRSLVLTGGGEPTVFPGFIKVLDYATNRLDVGLKTNGSIIKDEDIPILMKCKWIRISLDAADKETFTKTHGVDEFDNVCKNIKKLTTAKDDTTVGVGYLIGNETTKMDVYKAVKLAQDLQVDYIQFRPFSDWTDNGQLSTVIRIAQKTTSVKILFPNTARFGKKPKYKKCHAVHMCPKIAASMDVFACCARRDGEVYLGNLADTDFMSLWLNKEVDNINLGRCLDICRHHDKNVEIDLIISSLTTRHKNFI